MRLHLEFCTLLCGPHHWPMLVQRSPPRWLEKDWTFSPMKTGRESWGWAWRRLSGLTAALQDLKGVYKKGGGWPFTRTWSDKTKQNVFKLNESRFRLDFRKYFITVRIVRHWYMWHREVVDVPLLEVFKARLDVALSNLVYWKVPILWQRILEIDHRTVKIGRDLLGHIVKLSIQRKHNSHKNISLSVTTRCHLNTSRDSNSTTLLGN